MLSIGVVGAGIGGLTAALALREAGFNRVHVYEADQPGDAEETGVELTPNATRVLHALGLKDALQSRAGHPQFHVQRAWRSGFVLAQRPLGAFSEARYGAPHCIVGRAALLGMLLEACAAHGVRVTGGARCRAIKQTDDHVEVALSDRAAIHDLLIGCDGAGSTVRRFLRYPQPIARTDVAAFQGAAPMEALHATFAGNSVTSWLGPGRYLTHWPSPDGQRVELLAISLVPEADPTAGFPAWHEHVQALLGACGPLRPLPVIEHEPITQWYDRRVALLGDACHAMAPHLRQGAALAIEDAWVLSRMLERWEDEPTAGFEEYQRYRKVRITRMRRANRSHATQWACAAAGEVLARNAKLSLVSRFLPEIAMHQLDWLYGYDCIKGFE